MRKLFLALFLLIFCLGGMVGCMNETSNAKTAMIDVNAIITGGQHAQAAAKHIKEAQEIYQYNLNVIEKKLSAYANKDQARAYLIEAARQLQTQLNNSKLLVTQSLLNALNTVLDGQKSVYDLIIKKDGIIYIKEGEGDAGSKYAALPEDITVKVQALYSGTGVTFPPLPKVVEDPNLPADLGEGVPFPPQAEKTDVKEDPAQDKKESQSKDEKAKGKKE